MKTYKEFLFKENNYNNYKTLLDNLIDGDGMYYNENWYLLSDCLQELNKDTNQLSELIYNSDLCNEIKKPNFDAQTWNNIIISLIKIFNFNKNQIDYFYISCIRGNNNVFLNLWINFKNLYLNNIIQSINNYYGNEALNIINELQNNETDAITRMLKNNIIEQDSNVAAAIYYSCNSYESLIPRDNFTRSSLTIPYSLDRLINYNHNYDFIASDFLYISGFIDNNTKEEKKYQIKNLLEIAKNI